MLQRKLGLALTEEKGGYSSNSHKTYSLQKIIEYQEIEVFNAYPDEGECEKIVKSAKRKLEQGMSERKRIFNIAQTLASKSEEVLNLI